MDMTNDIIYIDGQNILTTWGLTPLSGKFYSEIMKHPDAKDRVTEDFTDEDGIRVLLTPTKLKAGEVTLSFDVDTYENYLAFCDYMDSHPTFVLSSFRVDKGIEYEFISHTEFNWYPECCTFGVKLREANFKNRGNIYLVTENNDYLCTDDGSKIIL